MKRRKVAIVLSGCGVFDGSEIHEAVAVLMSVEREGAEPVFFAPDKPQASVVNHKTGSESAGESRNVLVESARIARGKVFPLSEFRAEDFYALIFPGGFGAAKNLSTFASEGANCSVDREVEAAIKSALDAHIKIGFACISPVIAAKVISNGVRLTVGSDSSVASALESLGAKHVECPADSFVADEKFSVYSTPAYMLAENTVAMSDGIGKMVSEILRD